MSIIFKYSMNLLEKLDCISEKKLINTYGEFKGNLLLLLNGAVMLLICLITILIVQFIELPIKLAIHDGSLKEKWCSWLYTWKLLLSGERG